MSLSGSHWRSTTSGTPITARRCHQPETDDFSYNITDKPVHIHDLNATILHCLGVHHEKLTYRFQGRDFRLTDVHGTVMKDLLV